MYFEGGKVYQQVFRGQGTTAANRNSAQGQIVFNTRYDLELVGVAAHCIMFQSSVLNRVQVLTVDVGIEVTRQAFTGSRVADTVTGGNLTEVSGGQTCWVGALNAGVVPQRIYYPRVTDVPDPYAVGMIASGAFDPAQGASSYQLALYLFWRFLQDAEGDPIEQVSGNLEWLSTQAVPEVPKVFHG